jgi:hypothetical protein
MAEWKIRRRHGECSACAAAFEDGTRHASSLRFDEEESLVREDLCQTCWAAGDESTYVFWWFTRHEVDRKKTVQLDMGSLERLFMELQGREEEKLRELRYLLCLLLMRKRKLKLVKVKRGSKGEQLVLRRPRRTEELTVWVYEFTPDRMEELRTRLQEVLDGVGSEDGESEGQDSTQDPSEGAAPEEAREGAAEGSTDDQAEGSTDDQAEGSTDDRAEGSTQERAEGSTDEGADGSTPSPLEGAEDESAQAGVAAEVLSGPEDPARA